MSRKVKVSRPAQKDLDEIWLHIAQDKLEAADRFVDSITDKFLLLASSPGLGRRRDDLESGLLSFPVKNYLILYRLPHGQRLEIVRVVHGARDLTTLLR